MVTHMDDQAARLAALDQQVDALLAAYHAAIAGGKHAEAEAILNQRDEVALEAGIIRSAIEQTQTAAAVRLALAGALVDLDADDAPPITTTRAGLKLGGITIRISPPGAS